MWNPEEDGITHINVYSRGKTELGRWLSNFARSPIVTEDGHFMSIEGYWYWLGCKDDKLKLTYGYLAKKLGRELGAPDWLEGEEFKRKIKHAISIKLYTYPEKYRELKESTLPLAHYYNYGGKVVEPKQGRWIIEFLEEMRRRIRNECS